MRCPYCGYDNISGVDECESCSENLSSLDGVVPTTRIEKILMEDPISRMKPRDAIFVDSRQNVLEATRTMNRERVGSLLVQEKDQVVGILTERDIISKVLFQKRKVQAVPVDEVMTPNPMMLSEDDTLAYALHQMSVGGYRHVPILREGKPMGIISVRDVLKYLAKLFP